MKRPQPGHYTLIDELMADPVNPLPAENRRYTVGGMLQALDAIKTDPTPSVAHWRVLSDMVNMMDTLIEMGELEDNGGLINDAIVAMKGAAARQKAGQPLRFDGPGVLAMAALAEDFSAAVDALPARTMIRCHRQTEKRIRAIRKGQKRANDVVVEV